MAVVRHRFRLLRPAHGHHRQRHQHQHLRRKPDGQHQRRLLHPQRHWSWSQLVQHEVSSLSQRVVPAPWGPRAPSSTEPASATSAATHTAGPGYIQNNASLFKDFVLHENWVLDLRADAFQLTNSPQFASPSTSYHQRHLWTGHQHGRERHRDQRNRRRPHLAVLGHVALLSKPASATLIGGSWHDKLAQRF